jgi:hypothetical protein
LYCYCAPQPHFPNESRFAEGNVLTNGKSSNAQK